MSGVLCQAEINYCIEKLKEWWLMIPPQYVKKVQDKAREHNLEVPPKYKIHNVKNGRQFSKVIVDLLIETAKDAKKEFEKNTFSDSNTNSNDQN